MGLEHRDRGPQFGRVDVREQQSATAGPGHIGDHPVAAQRGREREPSQPQLEVDADAKTWDRILVPGSYAHIYCREKVWTDLEWTELLARDRT